MSKKRFSLQIEPYSFFSHQNEENTAKRSLFVVLKHFYRNWPKIGHYVKKVFFTINGATYMCFSHKMSKLQLNEACLLYCGIFMKFKKNY